MKPFKLIAALGAGLALSACATAPLENVSRNMPASVPLQQGDKADQALVAAPAVDPSPAVDPRSLNVVAVRVTVPQSLKVSEANGLLPRADIVWHGDPPGERHEQIKRIFEAGMEMGLKTLGDRQGDRPAELDIQVTRFHALTETARYTVGGIHAIQFYMQFRDPESGAPLGPRKFVKADFQAFGGLVALFAETAGQTQKTRINEHLASVIHEELTSAKGFQAPRLGLIDALNQG